MSRNRSKRWAILLTFFLSVSFVAAQHIAVFTSVEPTGQTPVLRLPSTHTFQLLAQEGDSLSNGHTLKTSPDFSAFLSKDGRNDQGYLSLNHEIGSQMGAVTVFELAFDSLSRLWNMYNGQPVDLSALHGSSKPCSGGITPWGTVIYGEETILTTDADSNKYHDSGWLVEIDPINRKAIQRIWRAGNTAHENCAPATDEKTLYLGADDGEFGYIFKYIAQEKRQLVQGELFVFIRDDSSATTGHWLAVPNNTAFDCNNINIFCRNHGAWNFAGVEDVEIGPDGAIYFAAKISGRVWRFQDDGATISALEVFVESTEYPIQTGDCIRWVPWGDGADNLAFDDRGNLWVLQDGTDNNIWMVAPDHSAAHPKVKLFGTTPIRSEPTGITFSPDYRFMFISLQHPKSSNADTVSDAAGKPVVFNRGTTLVIAQRAFLGAGLSQDFPLTLLHEKGTFKMAVFPNPIRSRAVSLRSDNFPKGLEVPIRVYDALGRLCHQEIYVAAAGTVGVDFSPSSTGVYRIVAVCGNKTGVSSFIVD